MAPPNQRPRRRSRPMPVLFHPQQLRHRPRFEWSLGKRIEHLERVTRAGRILAALSESDRFEVTAPRAPIRLAELEATHAPELVRYLRAACRKIDGASFYPNVFPKRFSMAAPRENLALAGFYCLDAGTPLTRHAFAAARYAAACAVEGAERLLVRTSREVYALCRPPGHHAERDLFGGYCYFNNAGLAAARLRRAGRVAIVDIDFHHGNGTQALFWEDPEVLVVSIHGEPASYFPFFSGFAGETGGGAARGTNLNLPMPAGVDDAAYRRLLERRVVPAVRAFAPASLVVSAGFDTYAGDPIGAFSLTGPFFAELGERLGRLELPTLIVQEGGYQVSELGRNVRRFLEGFLDGRGAGNVASVPPVRGRGRGSPPPRTARPLRPGRSARNSNGPDPRRQKRAPGR